MNRSANWLVFSGDASVTARLPMVEPPVVHAGDALVTADLVRLPSALDAGAFPAATTVERRGGGLL